MTKSNFRAILCLFFSSVDGDSLLLRLGSYFPTTRGVSFSSQLLSYSMQRQVQFFLRLGEVRRGSFHLSGTMSDGSRKTKPVADKGTTTFTLGMAGVNMSDNMDFIEDEQPDTPSKPTSITSSKKCNSAEANPNDTSAKKKPTCERKARMTAKKCRTPEVSERPSALKKHHLESLLGLSSIYKRVSMFFSLWYSLRCGVESFTIITKYGKLQSFTPEW
ncbi:hypothetical protein QBC32DRAFT_353988 [Pseudoneurospora amorphoporcata]|uniref:Uncharacterized protein n=1 Tax=Pseudoneurospora amorphoporcata TaxID=241081 RepID=A0AAN6SBI0_9PEZI|nr:hypothetical protein QBC32DRAFT_353988 [Pseudoneurospora amorphoporcata]